MRKTHCSGRKHEENVKDYYQKWIEGQAQSLIDKTTATSTRKDTFYFILCSSSCRGNDPTSLQSPRTSCPGMKLAPHMGGPPMMPMMSSPPPGIMPVGPAPRMRLAGVQPRLIQGIRSGDGVGDLFNYLFIKDIKSNRIRIAQ